ncbi:hypothetical protein OSH39_25020, partial [Mycobacterium ulcerans]|nr:hypothetical protein [Mycobacterium ulcerans]MEB4000361.1 hypothetical protein [Mycobacterium ulcerans]MEB4029311.1 hypothetical protein [Mycobacterium ulcerans]MEB4045842.1 hypothetical protein [Mycobacterium ulcerans]MEB4050000.1 hypothetical protein [Mycobacterium ulcerans]
PIARHQRSSTQLTSLLINNAGALLLGAANWANSQSINAARTRFLVIAPPRPCNARAVSGADSSRSCPRY